MSTAITILRLLTEKPPPRWKKNKRAKLSDEQNRLLQVLSDEWLENGTRGGQLLAERLKGDLTDERCVELGFETWLGICSLHRLVLYLMPESVFDEVAKSGDEQLAFRLVSWLRESALHALVASRVKRALSEAEDSDKELRSEPYAPVFVLSDLAVEFGSEGEELIGVIKVTDADRFEIEIEALSEGPLHELQQYRPPPERYTLWEYEEEW